MKWSEENEILQYLFYSIHEIIFWVFGEIPVLHELMFDFHFFFYRFYKKVLTWTFFKKSRTISKFLWKMWSIIDHLCMNYSFYTKKSLHTYRHYQCYIFHQVTQAFLTLQLEIVHVIKLSLGQCLRFLQTWKFVDIYSHL